MIDLRHEPTHHIQQHILGVLRYSEYVRFRDMRPPGVDSNLYSYHLGRLMAHKFVTKTKQGYSLSVKGVAYIDRVSPSTQKPREQPKVMTMVIIMDEHREVLVRRKKSQPMINKVTFVTGGFYMNDVSLEQSALDKVRQQAGLVLDTLEHIGDCYTRITHEGEVAMNTLIHVFFTRVRRADIEPKDVMFWRALNDFDDAAPASQRLAYELPELLEVGRFFREYSDTLQ